MSEVVVGIACEDHGHFSVVTRLVDDKLVLAHAWLDGVIGNCRSWRGIDENSSWYKYDAGDAYDLRSVNINGNCIARHGHILGQRLRPEASMWRKVLLLFCACEPRPEVVVLVRDMDGYSARRSGMTQVRDGIMWPFKVVVAAPQPEVEAWRVAGFVPSGEQERTELEAVRRDLSFDPTTESHRLTSHPNDASTDAKRVLTRLCGNDQERRDACLADRSRLRERGRDNGLREFLDEIEQRIVPLFGRAQ
jgi:hypothetical protein